MTELELGDGAGERGALLAAAPPGGERQVLAAAGAASAAGGYQLGLEAAAFAALPQPVWCIDAAGRVLSVNPAFCELAGCTLDGASGRPWTQLLLPHNGGASASDAPAVQRLQAAAAAGRPAQESLQCRSAAGALFGAQVSVSPLPSVKCDGGAGTASSVCVLLGGPAPPSHSTSSGLPAAVHAAAAPHAAAAAPLEVTPAAAPAAPAAAPAAPGSPQGVAVPPQLAQLCNQALASTSESVLIMDAARPGQPICWVNKSFERLTGYCQATVVGRSHSFLAGPDSDPVVLADIDAALAEERPITAELLVYRRDGTPFWSQVSITPIRHPGNGRVANWVAVQRDISKRKAAEAAMQMREQALSNLNEGITICDPSQKDCPVVYCNDAFLRITGYSRREIIGRNCRFLQGPKTDLATVQRLATALHEGREISVELTNYRKNGEEFINLLSVTPVRDASGRLLSFIGVQSDITELVRRRQAEKELKEAKVAAEMAAEAKSMFLANMSHEIRTPLNGMIAVAQLLLASGLTPEQRELADTILESGNTLLTILGDILDFSKIDHNSMALERAPLVLRDTVEASIEMVAADARRKGLELAYCLDEVLGSGRRLLGDSVRIRQVLANLLSNAVKFTSDGEVVVDAWVEGTPQEAAAQAAMHADSAPPSATCTSLDCPPECGDEAPPPPAFPRLHLTVRDTGIGIAPSSMSHLFQCFRQGHASMTRRYGGTGLGLAISRRLAHLMGGDVWVESEEGHGSTFHFTMALHWEGDTPSPSPAANSQPGSAAAALAEPAGVPAASLPRPPSTSFDSSVGVSAAEALPPGRRRSSSESAHSGPRPSFAAELGDHSAPDSVSVGSAGRGAEEQRQQLQAHHEALLAKLAHSSMQRPDGSPANASDAPLPVALSSAHSDAPDTPHMLAPGAARAGGAMSAVSSCSRLGTLTARTGSSSALAALTSLAAATTTARFSDSQRGSGDTQLAAMRGSRSGESFRSSGDASLRPPRPPPPPTADARTSAFFTTSRPLPALAAHPAGRPQAEETPSPQLPAADYRASSFFAPSQPLPPSPLHTLRPPSDEQPAVVAEAEPEGGAPHVPAPLQLSRQPLSPADAAAPDGACSAGDSASPAAAAQAAPGDDAVVGRRSADYQPSVASAPDPGLQRSAGGTPTGRAAAFAKAAADGLWGATSAAAGGPEAALLRGRSVCIDVAHGPTALQIAQSCLLLGMRATRAPCSAMAPHAQGQEFCITTADKALEAIRAGWRGRPLVVLGRREDLPLNLQPLATTVSKPVRHARLVAALLKAAAFSRSKQQAPLHSDPAMMTAMPDRISLNRLAVNRRISLDNSALDRRRWDAASAAAATAAAADAATADSSGPHELSHSGAPANGHGGSLRRSAEGHPGGAGGWQPQLPAIPSDDSAGESSQRSSMEGAAGGLPTIPEQPSMPGSPFAARAQRPATPEEPAALEPAAPAGHDLRILVAEDNLVNQMVIRKVLQRVVPAASVEIVGNGALALEAALARRPDLILMDIHMPEMDGIEASRRLHEALPPDEAPIVVALSADTLQMQDSKCTAAGFSAFICKPFRVEDVQRVLRLVQQ